MADNKPFWFEQNIGYREEREIEQHKKKLSYLNNLYFKTVSDDHRIYFIPSDSLALL